MDPPPGAFDAATRAETADFKEAAEEASGGESLGSPFLDEGS